MADQEELNDILDEVDDEDINLFFSDINFHHTIARRTNWRYHFTSLSQREVALAATFQNSIVTFMHLLATILMLINQLHMTICINQHHGTDNPRLQCLFLFLHVSDEMLVSSGRPFTGARRSVD
jgi:hypothetical protein